MKAYQAHVDRVVKLLGYRYAVVGLILLAVLALYGVAALSQPSDEATAAPALRGTRAPVTSALLACPSPGGSRISVLSPPSKGAGRADVVATDDGAALGTVTITGTVWARDVKSAPGSYTIKAQGMVASGLTAARMTYSGTGSGRGLSGVGCVEPGTDLRFVGPGPLAARSLDLYLTNLHAQEATVDVTAMSGEGPLDTADGRGTVVEPFSTRVIRLGKSPEGLGEIVNTAQFLGLRVHATTGRIAAAVRVRMDAKRGGDWLSPTTGAHTSVVVPGIPGGTGSRRLLVAVPGQSDARIKVQVLTPTGAFAPEGQDILDAPAQTITPVDLDKALSGKPAAVRLSSDRPVFAGVEAERGDDVAYGTGTMPLTPAAAGLIPDNRFRSSVLLTAGAAPATVTVTTVTTTGVAGSPQTVKIPANRTTEIKPSDPTGTGGTSGSSGSSGSNSSAGYGIIITPQPGSGPVYAARVMSTGTGDRLFTIAPTQPALTQLTLPATTDSFRTLIP